jgi:Carboxypeptidase regulatory-like domain
MMRSSAQVLFLCVALAFAASVASAQGGGLGTLSGVVLNAEGRPVEGARVIMQTATGGAPEATTTNARGRFFFPELVHGYYDLRASSAGRSSDWKHNVEVRTGEQTNVALRLARKGRRP